MDKYKIAVKDDNLVESSNIKCNELDIIQMEALNDSLKPNDPLFPDKRSTTECATQTGDSLLALSDNGRDADIGEENTNLLQPSRIFVDTTYTAPSELTDSTSQGNFFSAK